MEIIGSIDVLDRNKIDALPVRGANRSLVQTHNMLETWELLGHFIAPDNISIGGSIRDAHQIPEPIISVVPCQARVDLPHPTSSILISSSPTALSVASIGARYFLLP